MKSFILILLSLFLQISYGQYATPVITSYTQTGQLLQINGNNFGKTQPDHQYTMVQVITPEGLLSCSNVLVTKTVIKCNLPSLYSSDVSIRITIGFSKLVPLNPRPVLNYRKIEYNLNLKVVAKVLGTSGILPSNIITIDLLYISPNQLVNQTPTIQSTNNSTDDTLTCSTVSNFKTICDTPSEFGLHIFDLSVNTKSTYFDYVILQQ